jgi:hypothetical protein
MALSYDDSATLMRDPSFVNRIKVACLKYADYITNEGPGVTAHWSRLRWAQSVVQAPDAVALNLAPIVVMDGSVQQDGAAITDAALQSALEGAVNKTM